MKKTILDYFKKSYDAKLSVSARELNRVPDQLRGVAVSLNDGRDVITEEVRAMIRELRPKIMRLYPADANYQAWLDFCLAEEINPHVVLSADDAADAIRGTVAALREKFAGARRFYELDCDPNQAARGTDEEIEARAAVLNAAAEGLREADPDGEIILTGIMPYGADRGRAELWNARMLELCAANMNYIGVAWDPTPAGSRVWDAEADGIEVMHALAEEFKDAMLRVDRQIRESGAENVRVVLSGWHGIDDGVPQARQDCVYFTSVYESIRAMSDLIAAAEFGPLFGTAGLFDEEDGTVFANVSYQNLLLAANELEIPLTVEEFEHAKPIPAEHWAGVPGVVDPRDMKWVKVSASRSADGKTVHLLMTNRHPYKRAVLRVCFYGLPDLYPVEARILRSKSRTDGNSGAAPSKVYCKRLPLRPYRPMDHVNPDIGECSSVSMVLKVKDSD